MLGCDQAPRLLALLERADHLDEEIPRLLEHALECSECRAVLKEPELTSHCSFHSRRLMRVRGPIQAEAYSGILDSVFRSIADENDEIEKQRTVATALVNEILALSTEQQKLLVRNSGRYQTWPLVEELLIQARWGWTEDPCRSEGLAQLAVEVAEELTVTGFRARLLNDLKAEAWCYIANCRRIQSRYYEASKAFYQAELLLAIGSGDRLERARFLDFEASLLIDRGDFQWAERVLSEAIEEYRVAADRHLEGRALLKKAKLLRDCGRVEQTIPVLERAASLIDVGREPQLAFAMKRNLVLHLLEAGRLEEAQRALPEVRELAREYANRLGRLRLLWTEGLLCKALGQLDLAREALFQVREGFVAAEIGNDVALVSLDLAAVYLETGHTEEVRKLAAESVSLFSSRGAGSEVVVAWTLFREAAERDAVTLGLVQEVASRIRHAQPRPNETADLT